MASEAPRPSPPSSGSNVADSYIGSIISLISRSEIRYEGELYCLDVKHATIGLKDVKSFGTEGRQKDGPQIPSSDKVYEYILFRGSDIKDLNVKSSPPAKAEPFNDPAIMQTHISGASFSSPSVAVGERSQFQDTPAVISRVKPEYIHPYQSGMHLNSTHQAQSSQNLPGSLSSAPISLQGCISLADDHITPSLSQPSSLVPGTTHYPFQLSEPLSPVTSVLTSTSYGINRMASAVAPFPVHPTLSFPHTPGQFFNSPGVPPTPLNLPPSPYLPLVTSNNLVAASSHSAPDHSMVYPAPLGRPSLSPMLTPSPSTVAPNEHRSHMQNQFSYNDMHTLMPAKGDLSLISHQTHGEPLLPLPTPAPQHNLSAPFTEEFDFQAMNEKFNKDEVWGALGKFNENVTAETMGFGANQRSGVQESDGVVVKNNNATAYKKDEFFDTISCNSLSRGGRTGHNRFSDRMRMDTATFGNFQVRPPHQYYRAGPGQIFRCQYDMGRGHGSGGRGWRE